MSRLFYRIFAVLAFSAVAACSTPRGAGFQAEVLAAQDEKAADGSLQYDFAVVPITRGTHDVVRQWPTVGTTSYTWPQRQSQPESLLIAPGDLLSVLIWDAEENSLLTSPGQKVAELQQMQVQSDGRIFIPFVGEFRVAGMSEGTARARIEEQLVATVPSAQVQLRVLAGRANAAYLVSGMSRPGSYPLDGRNVSLLSLLSTGGGVRNDLNNPQLRLFRGNRVYGVSVDQLLKNPEMDLVVQGEDRIIIEEDARKFLSLGATGREAVHQFTWDDMTALDALSMVGGVSDTRANPQGILILREYPQSAVRADGKGGPSKDRVVFIIDLTSADGLFSAGEFPIMPDDLVYATESPIGAARTVFGIFTSALTLSNRL
tara:strand:+ start:9834 stop:10955 length:1122 start_codon:yes stop_codon:yes gene_type:complete